MADAVQMALGDFRFENASGTNYQSFDRSATYAWQSSPAFGDFDQHQFLGKAESLSITGVIFPHHRGGLNQLERMRQEASKGTPLLMVSGGTPGRQMGFWIIVSISEKQSSVLSSGEPLKQEFTLSLKRYQEEA